MSYLQALPESALITWFEAKMFVEHSISVDPDALHVIAGAIVFLVCARLFRCPISSWRVWAALLCVNLFNEFVDLWAERWPDSARQYGQGMKDLVLTMTVPTILVLVSRFAPTLLAPAVKPPQETAD